MGIVSGSRRLGSSRIVVLALGGLAIGTGCTHNHYYYGTSSPAYVVPGDAPVVIDEVCELPGRVVAGSRTLASRVSSAVSPDAGVAIDRTDPASRVIVSRPSGGSLAGRGWSVPGRSDRLVTTEVQGGADDSVIR